MVSGDSFAIDVSNHDRNTELKRGSKGISRSRDICLFLQQKTMIPWSDYYCHPEIISTREATSECRCREESLAEGLRVQPHSLISETKACVYPHLLHRLQGTEWPERSRGVEASTLGWVGATRGKRARLMAPRGHSVWGPPKPMHEPRGSRIY